MRNKDQSACRKNCMTILRHILLATIIATVVAWVWTHWERPMYATPKWTLWANDGAVITSWHQKNTKAVWHNRGGTGWTMLAARDQSWFSSPEYDGINWIIPFWFILAVLLPVWWLMGRESRQRKRWAKEGRCLSCGYNLQGSESGSCSECGAGYA